MSDTEEPNSRQIIEKPNDINLDDFKDLEDEEPVQANEEEEDVADLFGEDEDEDEEPVQSSRRKEKEQNDEEGEEEEEDGLFGSEEYVSLILFLP